MNSIPFPLRSPITMRFLAKIKNATKLIRCRRTKDEISRTTIPPPGDDNAFFEVIFVVGMVVVVIIR